MKRICLVTGGILPVPSVKGGAIEQLLDILIKQNEENPKCEFTIVCSEDKYSIANQLQYVHTKFVNIEKPWKIINVILWKIRLFTRNVFGYDCYKIIPYLHKVNNWLIANRVNYDYIIGEGCEIKLLQDVSSIHGIEKIIYHIHTEIFANSIYDKICKRYIAVSNYTKNCFLDTTKRNDCTIDVLYNRIDFTEFQYKLNSYERSQLRKQVGLSDDDFVLIFCGRLIQVKGVKELIESVISIGNEKIKLLIVGSSNFSGAKTTSYQKSILKLANKAKDRVFFTGYVNHSDLYKYHGIADAAVLPFLWEEAFSLSLLEFMTSGLPTIATISGGMPEVSDSTATIFIEKGDGIQDRIKKAILQLYNNSELMTSMVTATKGRTLFFQSSSYLDDFINIINSYNELC